MEWKCSKCGMPNFDGDVCKLCGATNPDAPEKPIEDVAAPEAEPVESAFEPVVIEYGPEEDASLAEEELEPETEEIPKEEEAPVLEEEPLAEEPEMEEIEELAEDTEEVPIPTPVPETKPKKRSKLPVILLIWVLIIAAAAYYLFVLKGDMLKSEMQEPTSVPAISESTEPFAEPSIEPEVSEEPEAEESSVPEESPIAGEQEAEIAPESEVVPSPTPVAPATVAPAPVKTPVPTKTPTPAPKVTKKYKIYTSTDYSFYAAYPVDFSTKTNLHGESLMHLSSYEDKVDMVIGGTKNWKKLSAKAALNQFLSYFSGTVVESSSGDTWYSATVNENGKVTKRKAFVKGGNICYVEFTYLESNEAEFLPCMNYVLDNFITMK